MSESLNRAFIKAYGKEKTSEIKRKANVEALQSQPAADLLMYFDTATVAVPNPYVIADRPIKVSTDGLSKPISEAVAPRAGMEAEPQGSTPVTVPTVESDASEASLRDSIVNQMLKAVDWQDQQINTFMGGYPVDLELHGAGAATLDHPAAAARTVARDESGLSTKQPVQNLDVLQEPALSAKNNQASLPTEKPASLSADFAAKIAQKNNDHEIFRLDRPSYSSDGKPVTDKSQYLSEETHGEQDSGGQSSILGELSASLTNIDIADVETQRGFRTEDVSELPIAADSSAAKDVSVEGVATVRSRDAATNSTRAIEENLRRAKVKIFNPVWEVDSLQWPQVCTELLQQTSQSMNQLARNLISACEEGLQILAVTSSQRGEGTTTVACCLALLAGGHGLKVAIVDGNIEHPTLSYQTNLDIEGDWRSAILSQLPLEEIAVHSIEDQVTLVPLLHPISRHEMAADDDRIASMLRELSECFDLVIVDMGAINADRNLVAGMGEQGLINAAVAVVDCRSSTPQTVEDCLQQIRNAGISSIGLVENYAA